jgi:hypothetical protein
MRKEEIVDLATLPEGNRDKNKRFLIVEMPAYQLEWFAARALMALGTSGIQVPQAIADLGAVGLLILGYQTFLNANPEAVRPLKDEMMQCVHEVKPGTVSEIMRGWDPSLVEEISTLKLLREKWLKLHTGFTFAELASTLTLALSAKNEAKTSLDTQTSPASSEQPSL